MDDQFLASWNPQSHASSADPGRAQRVREVENALLSLRFDGHRLPAGAHWQLERYLRGELSRQEAFIDFYGVGSVKQEAELWARRQPTDAKTDSQWPG